MRTVLKRYHKAMIIGGEGGRAGNAEEQAGRIGANVFWRAP
jgi:hypothetical protein